MSTAERKTGISLARLMAMLLIFFCHVFQARENLLAEYFNAGVQIFLVISGYLHGKKRINRVSDFYKKRLTRLLVPYYLALIVVVMVNLAQGIHSAPAQYLSSVLCLQWFLDPVPQCGHLWYITCILLCYLMTPVLQAVCIEMNKLRVGYIYAVWASAGLTLIASHAAHLLPNSIIMLEIYLLGYIIGFFHEPNQRDPSVRRKTAFVFLCAVLTLCAFYFMEIKTHVVCQRWLFIYCKCFFALSVFFFFQGIHVDKRLEEVLRWTDRCSYCFYLCHHMFVLGGLRNCFGIQSSMLDVPVAFVLSSAYSLILEFFSQKLIYQLMNNKRG